MKQFKYVEQLSIVLTFCAGFCDASTFFSGEGIFSSHVTSNFIVFVFDILTHANGKAWLKLVTLPVFVIASFTAERIFSKYKNANLLLLLQSLLLLFAGVLYITFKLTHITALWGIYFSTFIIVFAMSLQSAYGRLFSASAYGPTTAMTGNVTQLAIDIEKVVTINGAINRRNLKKQLTLISGFFVGAGVGGIVSKEIGLAGVVIPAVIILYTYIELHTNARKSYSLR